MFERTVLPSGIKILTESLPGQRGVALGAWIGCGSRHEPDQLSGATHFLEHLLFKGTPSRTALQIAQEFDQVGGEINAYTTKEFTCVHSRVLSEDLELAIGTTGDMLVHANLDPADVESERSVVLEEIAMHDDAPDDAVYDLFHGRLWGTHPLGRPVDGTAETISTMSRDDVAEFLSSHYVPGRIVVSAAGDVEHDRIVDLVAAAFADAIGGEPPAVSPAPPIEHGIVTQSRELEQAHVVYGAPGIVRGDERRWALWVLNTAFGGGMSSRLFQTIREERGLAYNVSSGHQGFSDAGVFNVYAGCRPDRVEEVLGLVRQEAASIVADGLTDEEFARARGHVRGALALSFDEPSSLMSHLGRSELLLGDVLTVDDMMQKVEAVTKDEVDALARDLLAPSAWTLAIVGAASTPALERFVDDAA